ncbi:MAG: CRTAC1 family protein [Pleurocapsa sp. MO_192.B19]|nr:CRTAC1 family protein [Pleurocapsa sp. MO_192.B19]
MSELENNNITFDDIAAGDNAGITYRRVESPRDAIFDELKQQPYTFEDIPRTPTKSRGAPGIAVFDYDNDGDLDVYVTNGPSAANSLYSNQLQETGEVTFIDVAEEAGVAATEQDSSGVSYGDIDNDGDYDLLVLGSGEPNRLFENQGDGSFVEITEQSGIGGGDKYSTSASMGDVNGDGLLDIVIANNFNWDNQIPIYIEPFALNEHNQLFINRGNNVFEDVSDSSGITNLAGFPEAEAGAASITWAIAMVDYDLDGDLDIIHADDQAAITPAQLGGVDSGFLHIFNNDGTGNFTDVSLETNLNITGSWMGLSFGDFNSDGYMDSFGSNLGEYPRLNLPGVFPNQTSRWFLGQANGTFIDPGLGELEATPFGWGTSTFDYDNDADTDIIFHGGLDLGLIVDASNPGALLQNDGEANFTYDSDGLANSTNHTRRNVQGVAVGDLNNDGFVDIVSVSNFDFPDAALADYEANYGSPFDETAAFVPTFIPTDNPGEFVWSGLEFPDGTLSVEINSADNGNNFVEVQTLGTVGLTEEGTVNRDGIVAVVLFTPEDGSTVMQPILGGSSYASQDSLAANFGLGEQERGTIEILWPGGVRNRIYDVSAGDRLVFPKFP